MADFTAKSNVKSAERKLAVPLTRAKMLAIVNNVLANNPWGCTAYLSAGENFAGVTKSSEYYSGKVIFENNLGKQVAAITIKAPTPEGFDTSVSTITGNTALATAMNGEASHDSSFDNFSVVLKCHASNGELYNVRFSPKSVTITSYEDDNILNTIETWADSITDLD